MKKIEVYLPEAERIINATRANPSLCIKELMDGFNSKRSARTVIVDGCSLTASKKMITLAGPPNEVERLRSL